MTKYTLAIITFRVGMPIRFEFNSIELREQFIVAFTNNLRRDDNDYITNIVLGERTFTVSKIKTV